MGQINPLTGSILQIGQTQPQEAAERTRQVRKAQETLKNALGTDDIVDIPVENTGEVEAIHDGHGEAQQGKKGNAGKHGDANGFKQALDHIDLTA
jgi:Flp pilus assembly CpaF family ATPase